MVEVNKTIGLEEEVRMKSLIGASLTYLEAKIVAPPDMAWNVVRLHTSVGSLDVCCLLSPLPVNDDEDEEEFGLIGISSGNAGEPLASDASVDVSRIEIGRTITGFEVVNDREDLFENGRAIYRRETTKALIIHTDGQDICLDRQVWFEEMLSISQGSDGRNLVTNEWVDWEDDEEEEPGIHYEFSMEYKVI